MDAVGLRFVWQNPSPQFVRLTYTRQDGAPHEEFSVLSELPSNFYVGVHMYAGFAVGHAVSIEPKQFSFNEIKDAKTESAKPDQNPPEQSANFESVFSNFVYTMGSYRNFISTMLTLSPLMAAANTENLIGTFVRLHGVKRDDLSTKNSVVYELAIKYITEYVGRHERVGAAMAGSRLIPEILIIGLVSAYDGFLGSLLRVVIDRRKEIVLNSTKELSYAELLAFSSIEEARSSLIEREVESVIRRSHSEHFDWMQKHLDVKLKDGLTVWPPFIELCERRNLFTHTSGVVSAQYLAVCKQHGANIQSISIGQRLDVSPDYYANAVRVVSEIGMKLCYVLWRKINKDEETLADGKFNERCMLLIASRDYALAEALLSFAYKAPRVNDQAKRMMIVNLANAIRLQGRDDEAVALLAKEDWSAANDEFRISIASVKGDIPEVLRMMDVLGARFERSNYRGCPVFTRTCDDERFQEKFLAIYGEQFLLTEKTISATPTELLSTEGISEAH